MLLYNKKGELTTTQIVGLIVLILSFVIILFLIFQLNLGETTQKEVCRDSVILKGRSILPVETTPLNCQQEYICFSKTSSCDAKIDNPDRIVKVASKNGLYRAIADEMADCWWMFSEGKINYVGSELVPDFYCSFCSQIYFDSSIKEIVGGDSFSQGELYDFIVKNNISSKDEGYDEYLYEGVDFKSSQEILDSIETEGSKAGFLPVNLDKTHVILMGITSDISTFTWVASGIGVGIGAAVGLILSPLAIGGTVIAGSIMIVSGAVIGAVGGAAVAEQIDLYYYTGTSMKGKSGLEYLRPIFIEKDSKVFEKFKCDHIITRT